ncbi:putative sugar ABC transporter permease protein [Oceanicola granulosus HTCC2516]|uniref:Putative sugar ABC transporter permease protein n=1 Tax=Oceanicola granulosus (strain ATCC BAA-861 / DSM 15982 / KCTC 12143 / HTCC2516) TaxID=314256 RepID=Q2CJ89_OCEGH|nr:ABC transporter permease [Oceanicola granulosus]EAR52711.1 putative sugar ABC transporter permease protein [Oceanicola granulosus HTCC2516]
MFFDAALIESIPRLFTPVLLAAIGSALCDRANVFNIALEGMMLIGAFAAVVGTFYTGNALAGLGLAIVSGALSGLVFAYFGVTRGGDHIIVSIGFNVLAIGLTAFLLGRIFGVSGQFDDPAIVQLPRIHLGPVADIPLIGPFVSGQSILVWLAIFLVVAVTWLLKNHKYGLRLRAAGQNAAAMRTVGVSPERVKTAAVIACGVLCAMGGAQLSISNVTLFTEGMSAGRGWIALVIMMMCSARLPWILPTAILFGLVDAFGFRMQGLGLPQQLTESMPYVLAIVVLMLVFRKRTARYAR